MVINPNVKVDNKKLYDKIKILRNKSIFRLLEITYNNPMNIKEIRSEVGLSYGRLEDYISLLHKEDLVVKEKEGRIIKVKSKINLKDLEL